MKKRLDNIDFLRFAFALLIAFHHFTASEVIKNSANAFVRNLPVATFNLPFIVDFFFVVAGFFLIYSFHGISVSDFVKKKYCQLVPLMLLYVGSIKIFSLFGITGASREPIMSLLLLDNVGLTLHSSGVAWFISAYFLVICFYYYLIKNYELKNVKLSLFLFMFFSYVFLINVNNANIATTKTFNCIINGGVLRALGGISIGCFIAWWYNNIKVVAQKSILWTLIEATSIGFLTYFFVTNPKWNSLIYVLIFCCCFVLFLLKRGYITNLFNNNLSVKLGKYALAIYLVHEPVLRFIRPMIFDPNSAFISNHIGITTILYLLGVFVVAFAAHHLVEVPGAKLMKKLLFKSQNNTKIDVEIKA